MLLTDANVRVSSKQLRFTDCFEKTSFEDVDRPILRLTELLK